jgi:hypothetical protein
MNTISKCLTAFALLAGATAANADTVYDVSVMAGGELVTGDITVAAGATGFLTPSEITQWTLTSSGSIPFSTGSSQSGSSVTCGPSPPLCGIGISSQTLTFSPQEPPSGFPPADELQFGVANAGTALYVTFFPLQLESQPHGAFVDPDGGYDPDAPSSPIAFGETLATVAPVPLPSSAWLMLSGVLALGAFGRRHVAARVAA